MKAIVVLICVLLMGCAQPTVEHYTNQKVGLHFYRPAPYVLINLSGAWQIVYLPDLSQEYIIYASKGFGNVDLKPSLENGWNLTGIDVSTNKTQGLDDIITAVSGGASVAKAMMGRTAPGFSVPLDYVPGLYKIDLTKNPPELIGPLSVLSGY